MSRGPTHRVRRMAASGAVSDELLRAAEHEADLLAHPYIGVEHVELARLRLAGLTAERDALRHSVPEGVPRAWWRPRDRYSALGPRGLEQTRRAQQLAEQKEQASGGGSR
ncbi:MAG: hypothetical protein ACR2ND_15535 [Solirubrobacteraceae bacterium]